MIEGDLDVFGPVEFDLRVALPILDSMPPIAPYRAGEDSSALPRWG